MIQYNALGAGMAQLVEQLIRNQQVAGSSPATSSKKKASQKTCFFLFYSKNRIFAFPALTKIYVQFLRKIPLVFLFYVIPRRHIHFPFKHVAEIGLRRKATPRGNFRQR